jgi:Zn-finger nucleic acid-binding protein
MSAPDAVHCSGCGRDLGLEPIGRDDTLECPDCRVPMSAFDCGAGAVHDCGRCGGQFVEHAALRDLIERHDQLDVGVRNVRAGPARGQGPVRYVACPVCRAMMNRKNFGGGSGVVVDACAKHGTWFDAGELPRALAFVESGGLARVRAREAEERERVARDHRAKDAGEAVTKVMAGAGDGPQLGGSILADLLFDLFGL